MYFFNYSWPVICILGYSICWLELFKLFCEVILREFEFLPGLIIHYWRSQCIWHIADSRHGNEFIKAATEDSEGKWEEKSEYKIQEERAHNYQPFSIRKWTYHEFFKVIKDVSFAFIPFQIITTEHSWVLSRCRCYIKVFLLLFGYLIEDYGFQNSQ